MTTSRVSVGWTTGSARSGRTRTVRALPVGALVGGQGSGPRVAGARRDPRTVRAHVDGGPTFLSLPLRHLFRSAHADTTFLGPPAPADGPPSPSQLLPCGPRAGAADVADEGSQAGGAARIENSAEHPSLALPAWEHSRNPDPTPKTFCEPLPASSRLACPFALQRLSP